MAQYVYRAKSNDGRVVSGKMDAAGRSEVVGRLRKQDLYCYELREIAGSAAVVNRPLKLKLLFPFCRQFSAMFRAGVGIAQALDTIYQSTANKQLKAVTLYLYEGVLRGNSLSETMRALGKTFPEFLISMVETGEMSGNLDTILEKMATYYEQQLATRKKIIGAMIYPIVLSIVCVVVVTFLLIFVMPTFVTMYAGVQLPGPTRALLALSGFLRSNFLMILLVIAAVVVSWMTLLKRREVRVSHDRRKLSLPIFGKLMRTLLTSRFATAFALLYGSGISMLTCVDITGRVLGNAYAEERMKLARDRLVQGRTLTEALTEANVLDRLALSMIQVGEESGSLDNMLTDSGEYFRSSGDATVSQMVAMLEPLMIVLFGGIICFIVLAIIMPVFSMYSLVA